MMKGLAPWLHIVNVCGSRPVGPEDTCTLPATIETVGRGEFPLAELISVLRNIKFAGDVGFQGYQIGGHPPTNLKKSIEAFRKVAGR